MALLNAGSKVETFSSLKNIRIYKKTYTRVLNNKHYLPSISEIALKLSPYLLKPCIAIAISLEFQHGSGVISLSICARTSYFKNNKLQENLGLSFRGQLVMEIDGPVV